MKAPPNALTSASTARWAAIFSFRLFGNLDKTQADAWDINQGHQSERTGILCRYFCRPGAKGW